MPLLVKSAVKGYFFDDQVEHYQQPQEEVAQGDKQQDKIKLICRSEIGPKGSIEVYDWIFEIIQEVDEYEDAADHPNSQKNIFLLLH